MVPQWLSANFSSWSFSVLEKKFETSPMPRNLCSGTPSLSSCTPLNSLNFISFIPTKRST
ncbi:hypothetical protein BpHYR1_011261 [Brachionus plicatilis]|uniref:Uncharacterized protein n=1 Tax=Brachionus plicatilis TaxID=10195 RepID=A0A3M7RCQ4_BRAPC|nr:hypothetical protein BpHYR1_011261 [Brachionus plicatilis]